MLLLLPSQVERAIRDAFPVLVVSPYPNSCCSAAASSQHIWRETCPSLARRDLRIGALRQLQAHMMSLLRTLEFNHMFELCIIPRSKPSWSSLHFVPKDSLGHWGPFWDYPTLNTATVSARYHLLYMQNFTSHLHGYSVFSKIDLVHAYHHIPVGLWQLHSVCSSFFECLMVSVTPLRLFKGSGILCSMEFPSAGFILTIFSPLVPLQSFISNVFVLYLPN